MTILIFSFKVIKYKEYNDSKEFNTLFSKIAEIQMLKDLKTWPLNLFAILPVFLQLSALKSQTFKVVFYQKVFTFFIDVAGHFDKNEWSYRHYFTNLKTLTRQCYHWESLFENTHRYLIHHLSIMFGKSKSVQTILELIIVQSRGKYRVFGHTFN